MTTIQNYFDEQFISDKMFEKTLICLNSCIWFYKNKYATEYTKPKTWITEYLCLRSSAPPVTYLSCNFVIYVPYTKLFECVTEPII